VIGGDAVGSLEAVSTPGHTPGHIAFLDRRDGTVLCGDVYTTIGGVATTTGRNLRFPLAISATWHGPTELESACALRALEPVRLAPGHGRVVESPVVAMDAAIARAS
jgi:glyoxylase-like metal-dependent hydrolase (beta-lactamase superfamily II)